jgi:hypothetical protein
MQEAETFLRTNGDAIFEGDSIAFLITIYKNENLPLNIRQNAAIAASSFERPRMSENRVLLLEKRAQEESEEQRNARIAEGDKRLDDLIAQWEWFVRERDSELQALISAGGVTVAAAETIRSWWQMPAEDAPLALPAPSEPTTGNFSQSPPEPRGRPPVSEMPPPLSEAIPESPNGQTSPLPAIDADRPPWLAEKQPRTAPEPEPQVTNADWIEVNVPTRAPGGGMRWLTKYVRRTG